MSKEAPGLRVLVVDDEAPARNELAYLLRQLPQIEVVAEAADADVQEWAFSEKT